MTDNCIICGSTMFLPYSKGQWAYPRACSKKCFLTLLEQWKIDEIKFKEGINIIENKNPDLSMKSFYERRLSEWLDNNNIKWKYEPYMFRMPVSTKAYRYVPDFLLTDYNVFLEVKAGLWEDMAYKKIFTFAKLYPLFLITPDILNIIRRVE